MGPETDPTVALKNSSRAAISVYAQGADYHDVIKGKLKDHRQRSRAPQRRGREGLRRHRARSWKSLSAEAAGLGWQGKHTNLVSREFGSWLFLGATSRLRS